MSMRRKLSASIALALTLTMLMTLTTSAQEVTYPDGAAQFRDKNAASDSLVVNIDLGPLGTLSQGSQYEGWLIDIAGNKVSTGTYGRDAELIDTYVDPEGANLLAQYPIFVVTIEPNPDDDPEPSGDIAYVASAPLVVNYWSAQLTSPGGPAKGMYDQASMAHMYAQNAQAEGLELDDLKVIAQSVVNLIEGSAGANYNAEVEGVNISDGLGVVGHAPEARDLAAQAEAGSGDNQSIEDTADEINRATHNTVAEARRVRNVALRILEATTLNFTVQKEVENLLSLSTRMLDGVDADGEGGPGSTGDEGGARTVYEKSQDLNQFILEHGTELPSVGDSTLPRLMLAALATGALLLAVGALLVFRSRRTATAAVA